MHRRRIKVTVLPGRRETWLDAGRITCITNQGEDRCCHRCPVRKVNTALEYGDSRLFIVAETAAEVRGMVEAAAGDS